MCETKFEPLELKSLEGNTDFVAPYYAHLVSILKKEFHATGDNLSLCVKSAREEGRPVGFSTDLLLDGFARIRNKAVEKGRILSDREKRQAYSLYTRAIGSLNRDAVRNDRASAWKIVKIERTNLVGNSDFINPLSSHLQSIMSSEYAAVGSDIVACAKDICLRKKIVDADFSNMIEKIAEIRNDVNNRGRILDEAEKDRFYGLYVEAFEDLQAARERYRAFLRGQPPLKRLYAQGKPWQATLAIALFCLFVSFAVFGISLLVRGDGNVFLLIWENLIMDSVQRVWGFLSNDANETVVLCIILVVVLLCAALAEGSCATGICGLLLLWLLAVLVVPVLVFLVASGIVCAAFTPVSSFFVKAIRAVCIGRGARTKAVRP